MFKVVAIAMYDGKEIPCNGYIEMENRGAGHVHVSWELRNEENMLVAGYSRGYFIGDKEYLPDEVVKLAVTKIETYRMRRKILFKDVKIITPGTEV
ncbi:MAG TPA: hypothetical protein VHM26_14990 [Chitinophagaceae bacterium]|jgi:hypothetical protein|nr:hypothetical protein [Chitinophagaceae bacterium]